MVFYETEITALGGECAEFVAANMLVLFGEGAPAELRDISAIHTVRVMAAEPILETGRVLEIGHHALRIVAVGTVAEDNLRSIGHLVIVKGGEDPILPGQIRVEGSWPSPGEVQIGRTVVVRDWTSKGS
ncbi:MAG: PTS glucitol/sorbitol transporter subunit IIA [Thermaerobacter sp.]|nr:PTS glucitol/sorbitol transporter subunit IIA [Thermaerobacter sp.]